MTPKSGRVWIDLETTGINQNIEFILEIAIGVTDIHGEWIDMRSWLLPPMYRAKQAAADRARRDSIVGPMHVKSGLWDALENAPSLGEVDAENLILSYLDNFRQDFDSPPPMCGSSVHFDRKFIAKFMPQLEMWFSHRNIDNSSTKELCKDLNPEVYKRMTEELKPQRQHRGCPDLVDTVDEYQFYLNNFLKVQV